MVRLRSDRVDPQARHERTGAIMHQQLYVHGCLHTRTHTHIDVGVGPPGNEPCPSRECCAGKNWEMAKRLLQRARTPPHPDRRPDFLSQSSERNRLVSSWKHANTHQRSTGSEWIRVLLVSRRKHKKQPLQGSPRLAPSCGRKGNYHLKWPQTFSVKIHDLYFSLQVNNCLLFCRKVLSLTFS